MAQNNAQSAPANAPEKAAVPVQEAVKKTTVKPEQSIMIQSGKDKVKITLSKNEFGVFILKTSGRINGENQSEKLTTKKHKLAISIYAEKASELVTRMNPCDEEETAPVTTEKTA